MMDVRDHPAGCDLIADQFRLEPLASKRYRLSGSLSDRTDTTDRWLVARSAPLARGWLRWASVVFDLGGVLIGSGRAYRGAWARRAARCPLAGSA